MRRKPSGSSKRLSSATSSDDATPTTFRVKVISIGDSQVGKSCLIKRYCERRFVERYVQTIGVDFGVKHVSVGATKLKVNFFDLSGLEEFDEVRSEFYADVRCVARCALRAARSPLQRRARSHALTYIYIYTIRWRASLLRRRKASWCVTIFRMRRASTRSTAGWKKRSATASLRACAASCARRRRRTVGDARSLPVMGAIGRAHTATTSLRRLQTQGMAWTPRSKRYSERSSNRSALR